MGIQGVSLNKSHIIQAIKDKKGILTHAAAAIGCDVRAIYDWRDRDDDVRQAIEEARVAREQDLMEKDKMLVDMAYESMRDLLEKRDNSSTIFTLKAKAKWTEKQAQGGAQIKIINEPYIESDD